MRKLTRFFLHGVLAIVLVTAPGVIFAQRSDSEEENLSTKEQMSLKHENSSSLSTEKTNARFHVGVYYGRPYWYRPYYYNYPHRPYYYTHYYYHYRPHYRQYNYYW